MRIKRIYHHFSKCEEFKSVMWQSSLGFDKKEKAKQCAEFMSDTDLFSAAMMLLSLSGHCHVRQTLQTQELIRLLGLVKLRLQ